MISRYGIVFFVLLTVCNAQILSFKEQSFEFGDIDNIDPVSRDVFFQNIGDKELIIEQVKASCGCTSSKLEKKNYQPMESGSLTVTFNPSGRSGRQTKNVTFISNDVENPKKSVSFTANVVPIWDVQPRRIEFSFDPDNNAYDDLTKSFSINNSSEKPLTVVSVSCSDANVTVAPANNKILEPGGKLELTASMSSDFHPEHYFSTRILTVIELDGQKTTRSIPLIVRTTR